MSKENPKQVLNWDFKKPLKPTDKPKSEKPERVASVKDTEPETIQPVTVFISEEEKKKATFFLHVSYIEKIKSYCYWERMDQWELIEKSLDQFIGEKQYDPVPDKKK